MASTSIGMMKLCFLLLVVVLRVNEVSMLIAQPRLEVVEVAVMRLVIIQRFIECASHACYNQSIPGNWIRSAVA